MPADSLQPMPVIDLGRMPYAAAFAEQRRVHGEVVARNQPATLLLVEHDPVITISRRKAATQHLLADENALARLGIDVQPTDRGGDITYHGPGQLVAYPIVRLSDLGLNVGRYMRRLERVVIDTVAAFGVEALRVEKATGVWVNRDAGSQAKLAAMGVRVSRNVSMHGLALNVDTDLRHFDTIVPCGLSNRAVTSLAELLGDDAPTMAQVKRELIAQVQRRLTSRSCGAATTSPT